MWAVENRTPYAVQRAFLRDRDGAEIWVVVVRATFDIAPDGATKVAKEQQPVVQAPVYLGTPGESSLLYDSDLVPSKPTTDVIVHGNAHGPKGARATRVAVRIEVGPVRKMLLIWGDRTWTPDGPSLPQPFSLLPIIYERAYGGAAPDRGLPPEPRNPIGSRSSGRAPNVVYPDDEQTPAGLGPIPREWEPRRALAGTFDNDWEQTRYPLFPRDLDERFFQCAPRDQQAPAYLHGGEAVALHHLTPEGLLRFRLPAPELTFHTVFGGAAVEHHGQLHTVIIEPERLRLQLVWHTRLRCHDNLYSLTRCLVTERST